MSEHTEQDSHSTEEEGYLCLYSFLVFMWQLPWNFGNGRYFIVFISIHPWFQGARRIHFFQTCWISWI